MKNILFAIAMISLPIFGWAQSSIDIFNEFKGKEDVTTVSISKYMFSMFSDVETGDPESQEFLDLVKTLDGMRILTTEDKTLGKKIISAVENNMDKNNFEELMTINEKGKNVIFMIKEKNKKVSELVMLVNESNEVVFMSIIGDIDLKKISKLSKKMNISGLESLESVDDNE